MPFLMAILTFLAYIFVFKMFFTTFAKNREEFIVRIHRRFLLLTSLILSQMLASCDFKLKPFDEEEADTLEIRIQRYDRMESLYLTTGDFSALQQMSTEYPIETRTLIERVLNLGNIDDSDINSKFLSFFQDSILQAVISDAELQYANMDDLNRQLSDAFHKLKTWMPDLRIPLIYTQISALDQSIVVGDASVGICLDKYLGENYPLYKRFYNKEQRKTMQRSYIVPDLLCFYLLSVYHLPNFREATQQERDVHLAKVQWVANKVMGNHFFDSDYLDAVDRYMVAHPEISISKLLTDTAMVRFDDK